MGEHTLRIGVIGTGLMGRLHAANLAFRVDGTELAAVCDIDRAAAVACAEHCEIDSSYDDYRDLLSHPGLDAVAVCTPPGTHGAIIEAASGAGMDIFCEKPLDADLTMIDRALEAVRSSGVTLQLGFNRRYDWRFRQAREAVAGGRIGTPD